MSGLPFEILAVLDLIPTFSRRRFDLTLVNFTSCILSDWYSMSQASDLPRQMTQREAAPSSCPVNGKKQPRLYHLELQRRLLQEIHACTVGSTENSMRRTQSGLAVMTLFFRDLYPEICVAFTHGLQVG